MKNIFLYTFILFSNIVFAQQSYYNDVDLSLTGMALKNELASKIISTHYNNLSYNEAREALKIIDLVPGQGTNVYLVYGFTNDICPSSPGNDNDHKRRNKSDFGGGSSCEWNREHTYPKSIGTPNLGTSGPGADVHMLRACDVQRNSQRGSKPFRDATGNSHIVNTNYWYPGDEWKGDIARMMMYMYLRYNTQCLPKNVGFGNTLAIDPNMIDLFLDWNAEDPVSEFEESRNNYLENTSNTYGQGNRNPFIDNPYLATRIWGGAVAEDIWDIYMGIDDSSLYSSTTLYPNPTEGKIFLKTNNIYNINYLTVYSFSGKKISQINNIQETGIDLKKLANGIYYIKINTTKGVFTKKIIIKK